MTEFKYSSIGWIDKTCCSVIIDQGISDFYRWLIPKYKNVKTQRHRAHITLVRSFEKPNYHFENFKKYSKYKTIKFFYSPYIYNDDKYYYLNCISPEIENIRTILGLPVFRFENCYHITLGNTK